MFLSLKDVNGNEILVNLDNVEYIKPAYDRTYIYTVGGRYIEISNRNSGVSIQYALNYLKRLKCMRESDFEEKDYSF